MNNKSVISSRLSSECPVRNVVCKHLSKSSVRKSKIYHQWEVGKSYPKITIWHNAQPHKYQCRWRDTSHIGGTTSTACKISDHFSKTFGGLLSGIWNCIREYPRFFMSLWSNPETVSKLILFSICFRNFLRSSAMPTGIGCFLRKSIPKRDLSERLRIRKGLSTKNTKICALRSSSKYSNNVIRIQEHPDSHGVQILLTSPQFSRN